MPLFILDQSVGMYQSQYNACFVYILFGALSLNMFTWTPPNDGYTIIIAGMWVHFEFYHVEVIFYSYLLPPRKVNKNFPVASK